MPSIKPNSMENNEALTTRVTMVVKGFRSYRRTYRINILSMFPVLTIHVYFQPQYLHLAPRLKGYHTCSIPEGKFHTLAVHLNVSHVVLENSRHVHLWELVLGEDDE